MKNFKLLTSVATVAVASCFVVASASAADIIKLELDAAATTETSKVVNVYYEGDTLGSVGSALLDIDFTDVADMSAATITSTSFSSPSLEENESPVYTVFVYNSNGNNTAVVDGSLLLGTVTFQVEAGAPEFEISTVYAEVAENDCLDSFDPATLVIPAWSTPEPPAPEKEEFTKATAVALADEPIADDTTTVPVKAWTTKIDFATKEVNGKLVWKITNADNGVATWDAVTASGEGEVVFGLAVAGRADELETIESVELVVE